MIPCLRRTGGDRETYFALIKRLMVRIHQLNQDLVRSRGKTGYNDRLATRVSPMPGGAIDGHMDVADPRWYRKRGRSEYRHDMQIFSEILDHYPAKRQRSGKRRIDDDLGRRLVRERHDRRCSTQLPGTLRAGSWRRRAGAPRRASS